MGFLGKTVFAKRLNKSNLFVPAIFVSIFSCGLVNTFGTSFAYATPVVDNYGLYTASDGARWEWEVVSDSENTAEPQKLNLMFYDKPEDLTTLTIPSYTEITTVSGVTPASDTYYVRNASQESQDTRFTNPDPVRRTGGADVTVLDMTNTSKVQIMGVKPIINPEVETELIFGENMVIGDGYRVEKSVNAWKCTGWSDYYVDEVYYHLCTTTELEIIPNAHTRVSGWYGKTFEEQMSYVLTPEDLGFILPTKKGTYRVNSWTFRERVIVRDDQFDSSLTYIDSSYTFTSTGYEIEEGVFSGYKLKLTNFSGFNYVGWNAFADSVLNASNTTMTINEDSFVGLDIFARTNIKKAIINSNNTGTGLFMDCSELTEVEFGQDVTVVGHLNFAGTNLGSFDFSETNIKTILRGAFNGAHLTEINLDGVEKLDYEAFANNDIKELVLPKSIKDINTARIFAGNSNLTKLTIAYDTLTTGTINPLHTVIGEWVGDDGNVANNIKRLTILAPYGENEVVSDTHVTYGDYPVTSFTKYDADNLSEQAVYLASEDDEAVKYKNVIAPGYFAYFGGVEDLIIGEGYEYVGAQAFYNYLYGPYIYNTNYYFDMGRDYSLIDKEFHVTLPETLKGIGGGAFASHYDNDFEINLPQSLEFIGNRAFYNDYLMKNDVDLPNLRYIGSHAFFTTGIRNLYLHDKLEWVGTRPFQGCWNLHDITFDYDVFGENSHLFFNGANNFGSSILGHITTGFPICNENACYEYYDREEVVTDGWGGYVHKLGNVTFTEKAVTEPTVMIRTDCLSDECNLGGFSVSWFYGVAADKIDLGKTGWKEISAGAFQFAAIDEVILPENLEKIWAGAFYGSRIKKELVLPDTITLIAQDAFNNFTSIENDGIYYDGQNYYNRNDEMLPREGFETRRYLTPEDHEPCRMEESYGEYRYYGRGCFRDNWDGTYYYRDPYGSTFGVTITKLPASLESIGAGAFYADERLRADLNLPNLKHIGGGAFNGSSIHNVKLGSSIETLGKFAFTNAHELEDIEIDFDIISLLYNKNLGSYYEDRKLDEVSFKSTFNKASGSDIADSGFGRIAFTNSSMTEPLSRSFTVKKTAECEFGVWNDYYCRDENGDLDHSFNRVSYVDVLSSFFYGTEADVIDLGDVQWTSLPMNIFNSAKVNTVILPHGIDLISNYAFYGAEVENPVEIPDGITAIDLQAFQYSTISFVNALPEGVTTIGAAAFYAADISGDFTIPSTVNSIGLSAFNAGDVDTHYNTVTIKPALDYSKTSEQAVFQMFWNASLDKLVIESSMLPVLGTLGDSPVLPHRDLRVDGEPEFHAMSMKEVAIKNLPIITANAFEECAYLETVDLSGHESLVEISERAFNNDTVLKKFIFGEGLVGKDVALKEYAFNNTAVETIGVTNDADFNLAAANFNTVEEHVFSNMPRLKSVDIPNNFNIDPSMADTEKNVNGAHITFFTFSDDPALEQVTIAYQIAEIRDGAFLNDEKLSKLFIWGNAEIQESDDLIRDFNNTTIPHGTNIFAYSDAPAENYVTDNSRSTYDGKFYPLDEVLYLTSNKTYVILEQDEEGNNTNFDKDGLILYALRRDGVILESDDWQTYTKAFPRAIAPNIKFDQGKGAAGNLGIDEELMWNVYDAPKPFNTISLANRNFENVDFEFIKMPSSTDPLVTIHYPDGYTAAIRTTTLASMTEKEEEEMLEELEVPNTGVFHTISGVAVASFSISAFIILGGILIVKKCKE